MSVSLSSYTLLIGVGYDRRARASVGQQWVSSAVNGIASLRGTRQCISYMQDA